MPVVLVANPKGGVGKSTIATNVAGYFASRGHAVMLGDVDRQQSSRLWLGLRPPQARPIATWEATGDSTVVRPPRGTTHAVLDTPAGLHGWRFKEVLALADRVIVPLQPSIFDIYATRDFLDRLKEQRRAEKTQIGLVGMRVNARTLAVIPRTMCNWRRAGSRCSTSRRVACSATWSSGSRSASGSTPEVVSRFSLSPVVASPTAGPAPLAPECPA